MTQQEIVKLRVINQTIDKVITVREAAELLGLSERQVIRLKGGVRKQGPAFIIHKNRGRRPSHTVADDLRKEIVRLKQSAYKKANFHHFHELLARREGITVSYPTVHRVLTAAGIPSPQKHSKPRAHPRRKRKPQRGMLVQIDASPHPWVLGEQRCDLHGAIDDATGEILALYFAPTECLAGYFQVMRDLVGHHGIPTNVYSDAHTIFVSPAKDKLTVEEQLAGKQVKLTQFGRALEELGIGIIIANSPQAKGRVERLWGTLQGRLTMEFQLANVTSIEEANAFMGEYIPIFNHRFAVVPASPDSAFRPLPEVINLDHILCRKDTRTLSHGIGFSYHGQYYELVQKTKTPQALPKRKITVLVSPTLGVKASYDGVLYDTVPIDKPVKKEAEKTPAVQSTRDKPKPHKPGPDHPWKITATQPRGGSRLPAETDAEILAMIRDLFNSSRAWI